MTEYLWLWEILKLVIIGTFFLITFVHQKKKMQVMGTAIKRQEELIKYQGQLLNNALVYCKLFDPEQVREWVKFREETIMMRLEKEMNAKMKNFEANKKKELNLIHKELLTAIEALDEMFYYSPHVIREAVVKHMPTSIVKLVFSQALDEYKASDKARPSEILRSMTPPKPPIEGKS